MNEKLKPYGLSFLIHFPLALSFLFLGSSLEKAKDKRIIEIDLSVIHFEEKAQPQKGPLDEKPKKVFETKSSPKVSEPVQEQRAKPEKVLSKEPLEEKPKMAFETEQRPETLEPVQEPKAHHKFELKERSETSGPAQELKAQSVDGTKTLETAGKFVNQGRISYPPIARRMGWEGRVLVSFVLTTSGEIRDLKILKSCGYEVLDREALEGIRRSYKDFPKPWTDVLVKLPVVFRLE